MAWKPPSPLLWPSLNVEHPAAGSFQVSLLDLAPSFLSCEESLGTLEFRFLFFVYRLFFLLIRAGAFIPALAVGPMDFRVVWKPLPAVKDIEKQLDALAAIAPPLLRLSGYKSKDS